MSVTGVLAAGTAISKKIGFDPVNAVLGLFGATESPADLDKQRIQDKLASMGYPQFSSMQGFKGDEKAKAEAMAIILSTVNTYPNSVSTLVSWLESGNITPRMIDDILETYPVQTAGDSSPLPTMTPTSTNKVTPGANAWKRYGTWGGILGLVVAGFYVLPKIGK